MVHGNHSDNHCNWSDTLLSIDTTARTMLAKTCSFSHLEVELSLSLFVLFFFFFFFLEPVKLSKASMSDRLLTLFPVFADLILNW